MSLTLTEVQRIASEVARQEDPALEVIGATPVGSESSYAELMLTVRGCRFEPCRVIIGVNRDTSESQCRTMVKERLQQHLAKHRADPSDQTF